MRHAIPFLLAAASVPAMAQQERLVQPATSAAAQPAAMPRTIDIGDASDDINLGRTTRALLQAQASGSHAGNRLPIPGDEATAAYRRYLRSFDHEIPEFFEIKVERSSEGSR